MNKLKDFFANHWEKVILGVVGIFCLYSLLISISGIMGSNNESMKIKAQGDEIRSILKRGKADPIDAQEKVVVEFQKAFIKHDIPEAYQKLLPARLFSEEQKNDPYDKVKDIVQGHSSSASLPGVNCEKFFCKERAKGDNICLVCGSKGDREYKYNPPKLTTLESLRANISSGLESNPYLDRQKIRIVWEDDIETDRSAFKDRVANVFRIEITAKNEKELMDMTDKPSYQMEMRDFIKNNKLKAYMKGDVILELVGDNVGGKGIYKALEKIPEQPKPAPAPGRAPLNDLFSNETAPQPNVNAPPENVVVEVVKANKLQDEKVFFNFEDTNFEPLKKYRYVLFEMFSGLSATGKPLSGWKFSKPVDIATGAENVFFLTKVYKELDENQAPVVKDGKQVYNADFKIYQYIRVQNLFYKKDFREIKVGEEVGSFIRKGEKIEDIIKTNIMKVKSPLPNRVIEPLRGTDLTDAEWTSWTEKYPKSMRARKDPVVIELTYFTGFKIIDIGEEDIKVMIPNGKPIGTGKFDAKGVEIMEQPMKQVDQHKQFVVLESVLTKVQQRLDVSIQKEIAVEVEKNKIKTIED
jgi:hypothetical protein